MELHDGVVFNPESAVAAHRKAEKKSLEPQHEAEKAAPEDKVSLSKSKKSDKVRVSFLPQDDLLPAEEKLIPVTDGKLENGRVRVAENPRYFPLARPDADGNFLYPTNDPRFAAGQVFVTVNSAVDLAEKYLGRPVEWGFRREDDKSHLLIHPHSGEGMNAFYNAEMGSLNFLFGDDKDTNSLVEAGKSADVVAHETGHALLDSIRPRYIDDIDVASGGFHEAFGDMVAMLVALSNESVVNAALDATHGDLHRSNILSRTGEQLGHAIFGDEHPYVRDSFNDQKYRDQYFLPSVKEPDGPSLEPHQYSGVASGAFYELFTRVYDGIREDPKVADKDAAAQARDVVGGLLFRAMEVAPVGKITYKEFARALCVADTLDNEGSHLKMILQSFVNRDVLGDEDLETLSQGLTNVPDVKLPENFKAEDAGKLLEHNAKKLGVVADDLKFSKMVTNTKGETFLQYTSEKKVYLSEPEWGSKFQGNSIKMNGGLLLGFDKDNKLMVETQDPITDDSIDRSKHFLRKMMEFQESPPIVVGRGKDKGTDSATEYLFSGLNVPLQVVGTEIRKAPIVY